MQRVTLVRYAAKPDRADENAALSLAVFDELKATKPDHLAYALFRNGADFVHLFVNLRDDESDSLTELPAFKAFTQDIGERYETPPEPLRLSVNLLDSYGF